MMRKLLAVLFAALFVSAVAWPPRPSSASRAALDESERRRPFALVLPELGTQPITAPEVVIPHANLSRLRLRVFKPFSDTINYGKIFTRINGESANTIVNINAATDGYIINADLQKLPRFRLQQGKNVVEIVAKSVDGREYYASYVLLTNDRKAADGGLASDATVESVPVAAGEDRLPPIVYLTQPAGSVRLTGETVAVKVVGVVVDNSGAVASVSVNAQAARLAPATGTRGLSVAVDEGEVGAEGLKNALEFEQTANVTAGAASLVVEARDKAGNVTRVTIPVKRREAAVSSAFKGRKFALVVGVSKYKFHDGGLRDLTYADVDARTVRDFLQQTEGGGFAPGDIVYLENERATTEAVRSALNTFLPKAATGDLIFIFIAGHGGPDPYAPQNLYFMLHDTKLADMPSTALPMTELQEALDHKVRAERLVVFVDTCHSAGLSGESLVATRGFENNLDRKSVV
jgi:hypothetical protein